MRDVLYDSFQAHIHTLEELLGYWKDRCRVAEEDRDHWKETADYLSTIVDAYAEKDEEGHSNGTQQGPERRGSEHRSQG